MTVHVHRVDAVTTLVLDRPSVNAFATDHLKHLAAAVDDVRADPKSRCLVIKAKGMFSAGADIDMMAALLQEPDPAERMVTFVSTMQAVYAAIEDLPIPTIAVIDRAATGGGLELALACDFRIIATSAMVGLPEVRIGLIPGAGGTQRLTRIVGPAIAKQLILTGDLIDGTSAVALGLAYQAVDPSDSDSAAQRLSSRSTAAAPPAVRAAKTCLAAAGTAHGFAAELDAVRELVATADTADRLAAFLSQRIHRR